MCHAWAPPWRAALALPWVSGPLLEGGRSGPLPASGQCTGRKLSPGLPTWASPTGQRHRAAGPSPPPGHVLRHSTVTPPRRVPTMVDAWWPPLTVAVTVYNSKTTTPPSLLDKGSPPPSAPAGRATGVCTAGAHRGRDAAALAACTRPRTPCRMPAVPDSTPPLRPLALVEGSAGGEEKEGERTLSSLRLGSAGRKVSPQACPHVPEASPSSQGQHVGPHHVSG